MDILFSHAPIYRQWLVGFKHHKPSAGRLCGATMMPWRAGQQLWSSQASVFLPHALGSSKIEIICYQTGSIQLNNPCFLLGPPSNPPQECGTLAGRAAKNRSCSEYGHWIWWFSPAFQESLIPLSICLSIYLPISLSLYREIGISLSLSSLSLSVFLCFFPIWESHIRDILGVHLESCSQNQRQLFEKVLKRARRKKSGLGSLWISLTCPPDIPQPKK